MESSLAAMHWLQCTVRSNSRLSGPSPGFCPGWMLQTGIYNDQSMTPCSVFAGESLPIDATTPGCPGREETTYLFIFLLPLFLFSLHFLMYQMAYGYPANSAKQEDFVCLLYFPQGNILYWSRNLMSNNSFKTAHLTSASQVIFCLFIWMSFKPHDHRGLCYNCQCLGKEMKTEVTWLLNGRKLF